MTTARGIFVSTALFTILLAVAYWIVAHEPAGTTLLGFMAGALLVVALYSAVAQRDADLYSDKKDATPADAAGEHVGTYVVHSPAPFWIGIAVAALALGLVVAPAIAGIGIIALMLLGALMILRSR